MMGRSPPPQGKLFYTNLNLDRRIRATHPLRRIAHLIDFEQKGSSILNKDLACSIVFTCHDRCVSNTKMPITMS